MEIEKLTGKGDTVTIRIPEPFKDLLGGDWAVTRGDQVEVMDFRGCMVHTLRKVRVATAGDAEKALALLRVFKDGKGKTETMAVEDFAVMFAELTHAAHEVWLAPDSAFLLEETRKTLSAEDALKVFGPLELPTNGVVPIGEDE